MVNVLADFHHNDLWYSLQLLFEKRLGWKLYSPIGLDWYHKGFWKIHPSIETAGQFLGLHQIMEKGQIEQCNLFDDTHEMEDGVYYYLDGSKDKIRRCITFDKFCDTDFDIIISSVPVHAVMYSNLVKQVKPRAKHIFQMGNNWHIPTQATKNILASTQPVPTGGLNICFYHQEFDLDVFDYQPPRNTKKVYSYIHWMQNKGMMDKFASMLPDFQFKSFGAGMDDHINRTEDIAAAYHNSDWNWYFKPGGDGYGYSLYRSGATGTPLIIWGQHLRAKLGSELLLDGTTCIDISSRSIQDSINMIKTCSQPERLKQMSEAMYNRFKQVVDFDEESVKIQKFLEGLT